MISIQDINKRIRTKGQSSTNLTNMREAQLFTDKNVFCKENAINSIKNWETLGNDIDGSYLEALNIFDHICEYCNDNTINECCDILVEAQTKVRNQTQLMNSLKYRIARFKKNKSTKLIKKYDDVTKKIKSALTVKPVSIKGVSISSGSSKGVARESAYEKLYEECTKNKECDRIIEMYNNISKRFNIDKVLEDVNTNTDIYEACGKICSYVDTYDSPFKNKYNTSLEMCSYILDKNFMNFPKSKIIEAVTDYFIFSNSLKESQYQDVKSIMDISVLYEQSDFSSISWMLKEPEKIQEENIDPNIYETYGVDSSILEFDLLNKKKKKKKEDGPVKSKMKEIIAGNPDERPDKQEQEVKDMIDDFRKTCTKDPTNKSLLSGFKSLIYKIYSKSPYQIVYELPNLFAILRMILIAAPAIVHPLLMVISFITSEILKIHMSRKQCEKALNAYNKEIDSIKKKLEKAKDGKSKEKLEKYLEELKKDKEKIEYYERSHYTDAENDERDAAKWAAEDNDSEWNFDMDDDDWGMDDDWDFEEVAKAIIMSDMVQAISEGLIDTDIDGIVYNNIFKLDNDSIDSLTDFSITVPVILEKEKLKEALINYRDELRNSSTKNYIRIDCINENIYRLNSAPQSYNTSNSTNHIINYLMCLKEFTRMNTDYITEMEFTNSIKLAINKMKKDAANLVDKEKQASSMIDVAANNISRKLEDAVKTKNREAVIRGSIIPSASKCIKLALIYGAEWCISPAIAIITAIGHFACSKAMQKKERQLVLDDIDLELKMCERYIRAAEDKGDLKKVREYEKLQRTLIRQKQRLQYRMLTIYNQKEAPKISKDDD